MTSVWNIAASLRIWLMVLGLCGSIVCFGMLVLYVSSPRFKHFVACIAAQWRISRLSAVVRCLVISVLVFRAFWCGGTKRNVHTNETCSVQRAPQRQQIVTERDGAVHREAVRSEPVHFDILPVTNDFAVVEYVYTNGIMDITSAWSPGCVGPLGVEALYGDSLTNRTFLGVWKTERTQNGLRILVDAESCELGSTGFVFIRPAQDVDHDGAADWYEVYGMGSSLALADTDSDGIPDEFESMLGTNAAVDDYEDAPKTRVGDAASLGAALGAATPYTIIELQPGTYRAGGLTLPDVPVLITSPNRGRNRQVVFRCDGVYAFAVPSSSESRSVIQGLCFEMSSGSGLRTGIWIGGNLPFGGAGAALRVQNCRFRMSSPDAHYHGIYTRNWNSQDLILAGCEFNALGSQSVRGISLIDSPNAYIENCSFLNFPPDGQYESSGIHYETTEDNRGGLPGTPTLEIVNTLFDGSFTNALALAPLAEGRPYSVTMKSCVVPAEPTHQPDVVTNQIVGTVSVNSRGYLLPGSIGIGAGVAPIYSTVDVNGVTRGESVDIGAARYIDPLSNQDTDEDGIRDWDEMELGTDPILADSDGDNINDGLELREETNPLNKNDYCFSARITIDNPARELTPASVALFALGTSTNVPISAVVFATNDVTVLNIPHRRSSGETPYRLVAWYDEDEDGELGDEKVYAEAVYSPNAHEAEFSLELPSPEKDSDDDGLSDWQEIVVLGTNPKRADSDGDTVPDGAEVNEGTDPFNPSNYCFNVHVTVTNKVVGFGDYLWSVAVSNDCGFVLQGAPFLFANAAHDEFDLPHQVIEDANLRYLVYWYDRNTNGLWDADSELLSYVRLQIRGHDNSLHITLDKRVKDFDGDEIPDWWELANGTEPRNRDDAYRDDDEDGLINLHEYWAGCDPLMADGSNTLLSVCARSVDMRLSRSSPDVSLERFNSYQQSSNASNLALNPNFWARDIDLSCASMWNDAGRDIWNEYCEPWQMAGTAISPVHVIEAYHYGIPTNSCLYFMSTNGVLCSRRITESRNVGGDIRIALLDSPLPDSVRPAKFLPENYSEYVGNGACLPTVTFDQEEKLLVHELNQLVPRSDRGTLTGAATPRQLVRRAFSESMIGGDSGNPRFLIVGNEPVLISTMWHGGGGSGSFLTHFLNEIRSAMRRLDDRYQLETIDLSQYQRLEGRNNE